MLTARIKKVLQDNLGLIFKTLITQFVNDVFGGLKASSFM